MESVKPKVEIVILSEGFWQSIGRDLSSFVTLGALVGLGWAIDSTAMQWIGAILGMLWICGRASRLGKHRMSISDARKRLDELEAGKP